MNIDFSTLEPAEIPRFKDGEGSVAASVHADASGKIMLLRIHPQSSVGMHRHETSYEVCYVLSGTGKAVCEGAEEPLAPGICHYCPQGCAHTMINTGSDDLVLYAVVAGT